jgi:hypothetical protein
VRFLEKALPRHDWILTVAQARVIDVSDERAAQGTKPGSKDSESSVSIFLTPGADRMCECLEDTSDELTKVPVGASIAPSLQTNLIVYRNHHAILQFFP